MLTPVGAYLRIARDADIRFCSKAWRAARRSRATRSSERIPRKFSALAAAIACSNPAASALAFEGNPIEELRRLTLRFHPVRVPGLPPLIAGAIGYFAYDMVRLVEHIPATGRDDMGLDDCVMMFYLGVLAFDHVQHRVWITRNVFTEGQGQPAGEIRRRRARNPADAAHARAPAAAETPRAPAPSHLKVRSNMSRAQFMAGVRKAKEYIRAGDIFQVVPSQRFSAEISADPFDIYRALRVVNPSPYLYFLRLDDVSVVGSSPEMLVKVQGRDVFYRPIAGTLPRGRDEKEDRELEAQASRRSQRARRTHHAGGSRPQRSRPRVRIRQRESGAADVRRALFARDASGLDSARTSCAKDVDCFDALMACFPAGTLSGAPKIRAMEIIDELEPTRRGTYGGAILYLDFSGNLDSCIALRTLVAKNGRAYVQAGAGIVADSVPAREYSETVNKARAVITALEIAHRTAGGGRGTR